MKKYNILGIVPYWGIGHKLVNNHTDIYVLDRFKDLKRTVESIASFSNRIIIGTNYEYNINQIKKEIVNNIPNTTIEAVLVKPPHDILVESHTVIHAQKSPFTEDYVYYSEDDQIIHIADLDKLISKLDINTFIAPHRFADLTYDGPSIHHSRLSKNNKIEYLGKKYMVTNVEDITQLDKSEYFYKNRYYDEAYGAAYLCTAELFRKVHFANSLSPDPRTQVSGIDIFSTARGYKTSNIYDFYVEHTSVSLKWKDKQNE